MGQVYYISAKDYLTVNDTSIHIANKETGKRKPLAKLRARFVRILLRSPGKGVGYPALIEGIWGDGDDVFGNYIDGLQNLKRNCVKDFKQFGLPDEAADKIIEFDKDIEGYRINLYTASNPQMEFNPSISNMLLVSGIRNSELSDVVNTLLYKGISGKMGRHTLMALASQSNPIACFEMGELYFYGHASQKNNSPDYKTARSWYEKAGDHPCALWTIGYMIMENKEPHVPEEEIDYAQALYYLKRAGEHCAPALNSIGKLWERGCYPCKDFKTTGRCEPANEKEALAYYKRAADMDYHYAMNNLGLWYEKNGRYTEARRWFERSASIVSDAYTYNKLGLLYEAGRGGDKNPEKACEYYLKSVNEVLPDDATPWGQYNAARVYSNRIPTPFSARHYDPVRAWELYTKAMSGLDVLKHDQMLRSMLETLMDMALGHEQTPFPAALYNQTLFHLNKYFRAAGESENARIIRNMHNDLKLLLDTAGQTE